MSNHISEQTAIFNRLSDYFELTKPRVTLMVVLTTLFGFYLGAHGEMDFILLLHTLFGTALVAGGTSALNQYFERDLDAKMLRTRHRPLPAGRLAPGAALTFGVSISVLGIAYLILLVNALTGLLAAITLISYVFVYTPLKQKSSLSTIIGAIPGALPPMGGWTAVRNEIGVEAWILFAILFLWQLPHFLAIAWIYRDDYARGGFRMLTVIDPEGGSAGRQIIANCIALLSVSLLPTLIGLTGKTYFIAALLLGLAFLSVGISVIISRNTAAAQRLMRASLIYLPALLGVMAWDKTF